ncbi:MAG: CubicO group peptidase (beta-lactamase class C family) [Neolewinella sp.]|jgi:CubicO group peptidase (beta-lactamase class C family)
MLPRMPTLSFAFAIAISAALLPAQQGAAKPTTPELNFAAAAEFSDENAGLAVLIYDDGKLVFEQYQNGHKQNRTQHIFSGTKSFVPMVALIAQKEGLLTLDEKVCDTITEWQGDEEREQITVRHLLNFTSGLKNIDSQLHSARARDVYGASVACECTRTPGKRFEYGSNHLMVFGELFKRKLLAATKLQAATTKQQPLPKDFVGYLNDRILKPIGCKFGSWLRDKKGNPALPYGAYMTAREWAKFGLLVLNRGKHGDEQLIPTEHFDECFVGTKAMPSYGLNFWLVGKGANRRNQAIPTDTVTAAGMYNQKLYIIPSKKLLVVRLGRTGARTRFNDNKFLTALLGKVD